MPLAIYMFKFNFPRSNFSVNYSYDFLNLLSFTFSLGSVRIKLMEIMTMRTLHGKYNIYKAVPRRMAVYHFSSLYIVHKSLLKLLAGLLTSFLVRHCILPCTYIYVYIFIYVKQSMIYPKLT